MLSDFNKQVIRDYGVFNEDMIGLKGIAKRAVFVIDKAGIVRHREVLDDARNEPNYEKVLEALRRCSAEGVDTGGWRPMGRRGLIRDRHSLTSEPVLSYTEYMSTCSYIQI